MEVCKRCGRRFESGWGSYCSSSCQDADREESRRHEEAQAMEREKLASEKRKQAMEREKLAFEKRKAEEEAKRAKEAAKLEQEKIEYEQSKLPCPWCGVKFVAAEGVLCGDKFFCSRKCINEFAATPEGQVECQKTLSAEELVLIGNSYSEKNRYAATAYYTAAVELGHAGAMAKLGVAYEKGYGVKKDFESALKFYKQSVEAGNEKPLLWIANLYAKQDKHVSALKYYKQAADKGIKKAYERIGWYYEQGLGGLPKDYEKAIEYYKLGGDEDDIQRVENAMREEEEEKARIQQLADEAIRREKEEKAKGKSYIALVFNWLLCGYLLLWFAALYLGGKIPAYFQNSKYMWDDLTFHWYHLDVWLVTVCAFANFICMWRRVKGKIYRQMFKWSYFGKWLLMTILILVAVTFFYGGHELVNSSENTGASEQVEVEEEVVEETEEVVEEPAEEAEDYF